MRFLTVLRTIATIISVVLPGQVLAVEFVPVGPRAAGMGGAGVATLWVNIDPASYYDAVEYRLIDVAKPAWIAGETLVITPITVVTDLLMAFFMFFVGKELWEALVLDRGALAGRRAVIPAAAATGAAAGAIALWLLYTQVGGACRPAMQPAWTAIELYSGWCTSL